MHLDLVEKLGSINKQVRNKKTGKNQKVLKLEAALELVEKHAEPNVFSIVFNGRLFKQLTEREPKPPHDWY